MIAATTDWLSTGGWIVGVTAILASAIAAVNTFRKTKPETTGILVDASKEVVLIQGTLLDRIQNQLGEALRQNAELSARVASLEDKADAALNEAISLRVEVTRLHDENGKLTKALAAARKRITELEK